MSKIAPRTPPQAIQLSSYFFVENQDFPMICFYGTFANQKQSRKTSVNRGGIQNVFRSIKQKKQKDIRKCGNLFASLLTLQTGGRLLIRNLLEKGGTGKVRSYQEPVAHIIIKDIGQNLKPIQYNQKLLQKVSPVCYTETCYFCAIVYETILIGT